jgi:hypothetical protein
MTTHTPTYKNRNKKKLFNEKKSLKIIEIYLS